MLCLQRGCGAHRSVHRDRRDAGANQAREDGGHLRTRHVPARTAQLHGTCTSLVFKYANRAGI